MTQASLMPVHIVGRNSWFFYLLGTVHPLLRTIWLVRELINKGGQTIIMKFGPVEPFGNFVQCASDHALTSAMYLRTLLLSNSLEHAGSHEHINSHELINSHKREMPALSMNTGYHSQPVPPLNSERLCEEIAELPHRSLLLRKGDFDVWYSTAGEIPHILQEIGRLREISFRAAGEGTGYEIDIDRFDSQYLHLFLWNRARSENCGCLSPGAGG